MKFFLEKGIVKIGAKPIDPEQLYRTGSLRVLINCEETKLSISKRPVDIRLRFTVDPSPRFSIVFRDEVLGEFQQKALIEHGYFILNDTRVHFVNTSVKKYMEAAFSDHTLPALIKLLRTLFHKGLLDQPPADLIETLRTKSQKQIQHKNLFVRELYDYQREGVEWLSFCAENGVGTILADDMGLGKTAQVIALCCDLLEKSPKSKILIVVPNPLIDNWVREFAFFAPTLAPYLHYGMNRRGDSNAVSKQSIIITPYTTMTSDIAMLEELSFDLTLFDEASLLKNPTSGRSTAARRLNSFVSVAMSGTPVENSLVDAWALSDLVFPGFLGNIEDFTSRYVNADLSKTVGSDLGELETSLRQITLRRMKDDVLTQLPEKIDLHTAVSLGETELASYETIICEMKKDLTSGGAGILPLINKLQQFTAHPALIDTSITHDLRSLSGRSAKFELLLIKLDAIAFSAEKVIIFATFQKAIDLIQLAIQEKYGVTAGTIDGRTPNDERQGLIDKFSSTDGFDVLILHPRTAGMGLNITAATHVIHYSRQWNPALEAQATARAWRNGQESIVTVHYLYYANTIEETIDERLRLKQSLSDQVVTVADAKGSDKELMLNYLESMNL